MEKILFYGQTYAQWIIMGMLLVQLMAIFVSMHKITVIRKQLKRITKQVQDYLQVVMESEEENARKMQENRRASEKEAQTQLISSVLEEIFP